MPEEKDYNGKERRRFPRENIAVVEYAREDSGAQKSLCFPRNISMGGISIIVSEDLALNTILKLTLYLPKSDRPVEVKGRIRWKGEILKLPHRKHWMLGIEFIEISEDFQRKLCEAIE